MKVNVNWLPSHYNDGGENRDFRGYGSNKENRPVNTGMFIVKKNKTVKDFSAMLINEFHGLKLQADGQKFDGIGLYENTGAKTGKKNKIIGDDDFKAISFLNEYWA